MIRAHLIMLLAILFMIMGFGSASIPDGVIISTDSPWVIAGSTDGARITVQVFNNTNPISGAQVHVYLDAPTMGTISPEYIRTDANGITERPFLFFPGTKSGLVNVFVSVTDPITGMSYSNISWSIKQNIDHADPFQWETISYNSPLWVNTTTPITVRLIDRYKNVIDDRRIAETITFSDSEGGDGGFLKDGAFYNKIPVPVQSDGYATVTYKTSSKPSGTNILLIVAPETTSPNFQWITIQGNATAPTTIESIITSDHDPNPSKPHQALANNRDMFSIKYIVEDEFGNPVPNIKVNWLSSTGKTGSSITNAYGYILIRYGPSTIVQNITINATLADYPTLNRSDTLEFISGGAQFMEVSTSPQIIASRDVNPKVVSQIIAHILDSAGRPVSDEGVTFEIVDDYALPPATLNASATLSLVGDTQASTKITLKTNEDGQAIIEYHPGSFPLFGQTGYYRTATGKTTINVTWDGEEKNPVITYKNYPYIATRTSTDYSVVEEGEFINVTIQLIGDGYAFENPVDVVLLEDRADSMLRRVDKGVHEDEDRMLHAQNAARVFLGMLEPGKDRVGIVSFGEKTESANLYSISQMTKLAGDDNQASDDISYIKKYYPSNNRSYDDWATIDLNLTTDFNKGITAYQILNETVPFKNTFGGQPSAGFRYGIYKSITHILEYDSGSSSVKAVVGLLDTDYTWFGDPKVDPSGTPGDNPFNMGGSTNRYYPFNGPDYTGHWSLANASQDWQNMSNYAKDNGIRLYVVTYTPDVPTSRRVTLSELCEPTGGFHIHAATPEELQEAFRLIAEDIKSAAGEGTAMELSLSEINVTHEDLGVEKHDVFPGSSVFNYTYIPGISTFVDSWNCTDVQDSSTCAEITDELELPPPFDAISHYPYNWNHTQEWSDTQGLSLFVGNISIKQIWQATFTLKTNMSGSICLFGTGSEICFTDFEDNDYCSDVPPVCFSVEKNLTLGPHTPGVLDIQDHSVAANVTSGYDEINVTWNLSFNTTRPIKQIGFYSYTKDNISWSDWIQFGINNTGSRIKDQRIIIPFTPYEFKKPVGDMLGCYIFKIFAYEDLDGYMGASDEEEMSREEKICVLSNPQIKIE
jgi:hypothetical protein